MPRNDRYIQYRCERCRSPENVPGSCKCTVERKTRPVRTPDEIADRILKDVEAVPDPATGLETRFPSRGNVCANTLVLTMYKPGCKEPVEVDVIIETTFENGKYRETNRRINRVSEYFGEEWAERGLASSKDISVLIDGMNALCNNKRSEQ